MELLFPAIAATTPTAPALYACRDIEFRKETRVKRGVHLKLERKGSLGFTGSWEQEQEEQAAALAGKARIEENKEKDNFENKSFFKGILGINN